MKGLAVIGMLVLWLGGRLIMFRLADQINEGLSFEEQKRAWDESGNGILKAHRKRYPESSLRLIWVLSHVFLAIWFIWVVWTFFLAPRLVR